jgi:hypothetical protein
LHSILHSSFCILSFPPEVLMPTKKGKSKPAKAKKTSNKLRKTRPAAGKRPAKRAGAARKKKPAGRLRRTEAGPVWIGSSPAPIVRPDRETGDQKAGDGGSGRVVIL